MVHYLGSANVSTRYQFATRLSEMEIEGFQLGEFPIMNPSVSVPVMLSPLTEVSIFTANGRTYATIDPNTSTMFPATVPLTGIPPLTGEAINVPIRELPL